MDLKVKQAIQRLSDTTGIPLSIDAKVSSEEILERIQLVEKAYKETFSEEYFLLSLLRNDQNGKPLNHGKFFLRINSGGYVILLNYATAQEEEMLDLLRAIFPERKKTYLVQIEAGMIAVVRFQEKNNPENLIMEFHSVRDQIQSELLCECWIGIGKYFEEKSKCFKSYEQAKYAIKVGQTFFRKEQVYCFEKLGFYRLIEDLSPEVREDFFQEIMAQKMDKEFMFNLDEDLKNIAAEFFTYDLNVSETARNLYMHRNTLLHKLDKIQEETGQDIRTFSGAVNLMFLLMIQQKM